MSATPTYVIVYGGRHFGRVHRLLNREGLTWTAIHEASGDVVSFLKCDSEPVTIQCQ